MSNQEEESTEIDEFAMFKARSLGVESEYLEMARVGLLRRSMRQRVPLESTKQTRPNHDQSYIDQNGVLAGSHQQHHNNPGRMNDGAEEDGVTGHLLPGGITNLQRAHSFRSNRRTHGEKRPSTIQHGDHTPTADDTEEEPGKFSRQRNMTMPARRRFDSRAGHHATAGTQNENSRSRYQRSTASNDEEGNQHLLIGDRSVLRVRNFTTKDGNIINRGDSIKIRRGTKTSGLSSPMAKDNLTPFGCGTPQSRDVKLSPRSGSLKSTSNAGGFAARKSIAASLVSGEGQRAYSSSATHLAVGRGEGSPVEEVPQRCDSQIKSHRLSRQFQSQDEERLISTSSTSQSHGKLAESEMSTSTSSNFGSKLTRPPSHSSTQHDQIGEEEIELDYIGEPRSANDRDQYSQAAVQQQQQQLQGSQKSLSKAAVAQDQIETETTGAVPEERDERSGGEEEEEQVVYKVVVMGSAGVGKTTLTHQMLTSEYLANNENEIDDDSTDKIVSVQIDGEESLLQLIDQPGQQGVKRKDASIQADANLVVYSVTDRNSYAFAQTCLQDLRPAKRHNVVILVANKQDLVRNRIISEDDGKSLAHKRHCKFIEVSALLSHKIDDLLVGVTRQIRLRKAVSGESAKAANQSDGNKSKNVDSDIRVGCLQRAAMDIFRRITRRRRLVESSSCDDLFKP